MTTMARTLPLVGLAAAVALTACGSDDEDASGDGPVSLRIHVEGGGAVPEDDPIKENLDDALGVDVDLTNTAGEDYYTQIAADLAAGDAPDLFQVDRSHLQQFVNQGLILDLTDYLQDELSPYLDQADEAALQVVTFDGSQYGFTTRTPTNYSSYWIRKDWLDNLGLDVPTTTDQFRDVAIAFAQNDPDGNGHNDTYGLTGGNTGVMWYPLYPAFGSGGFGTPLGFQGGGFYVEGSEIVNGLYDPDTVEALKYINGLVASGAVDPDFPAMDEQQAQERALQGTAGIINRGWPEMTKPEFVEQFKAAQPDAEWIQIAPPVGPGGESGYPFDANNARAYAIPRTLEDEPEKLAKLFELINHVSQDDGRTLVTYGVEGEHYTLEGDQIVPTDLLASEGGYFWLYQFAGRDEEEYLGIKFAAQQENIHFAWDQPTLDLYNSLVVAPEGFNSSDAGRFVEEGVIGFISGERPVEEYDDFLDTLSNQFGMREYVDSGIEQLEALGIG